jgi:hypothetical protein
VLNGENNAALLYGFWVTALRQGTFYPLAIVAANDENVQTD